MQKDDPFPFQFRLSATLVLLVGIWLAYPELSLIWAPEPAKASLFAPVGAATAALYILLLLAAVGILAASIWRPQSIRSTAARISPFAWPLAVILIGLLGWIHLYSPWQAILIGPWAQFLLAAGLARLIAWSFNPGQDHPFGWDELALAFALFLFPRMVQEARIVFPASGLSRVALVAVVGALLLLIGLLYGRFGGILRPRLLAFRTRLGSLRPWVISLVVLAPLFYRYVLGAGGYILYPNIRFAVWLLAFWAAAYLLCTSPDQVLSLRAAAESCGWLVLTSAVTQLLLQVVNYPFSLSWSEGNRFYDYSLIFGQNLYNHPAAIINPYDSPGRYILWGVMFLWQGLPIWVHRLWNLVLLTAPSLLLAWILTRRIGTAWRRVLFLWVSAFFIIIAPLHPPFMLVLIIVAAFAFHPSPAVRGISLVVASLYAGISRWTWVVAPGAWGALIDLLLYYPNRKGNWFRRLLPTVGMTLLGAGPGLLLKANVFGQLSSGETFVSSQPLLWYRLFPNATLGPGILLLMVFSTGPLVALLVYQVVTRRWRLDLFQQLAIWGALAGFLGAGLVISTKIGGGGDLHNLDMYVGTLMLVTTLLLSVRSEPQPGEHPEIAPGRSPAWVWAMILLLAVQPLYPFTPFNPSANYDKWLDLPTQSDTAQTLNEIRAAVAQYSRNGQVLFMDQRQLLTFGYVNAIPFVSEYEKKYMMDQAMASNAGYFRPYYQDLQDRRFTLIVTEPLKTGLKGQTGVFSEENDLWVYWVSVPTLCFYEPIMTDKSVGVQMLVPRENPKGCEKYLQQVGP